MRASSSVPTAWLDSGWLHLKSPLSVPAAELDAQALFVLINTHASCAQSQVKTQCGIARTLGNLVLKFHTFIFTIKTESIYTVVHSIFSWFGGKNVENSCVCNGGEGGELN